MIYKLYHGPLEFLQGPPAFKVIVSQADLERIFKGVEEALEVEGKKLVERLGRTAVEFLQASYRGLDRDYLARHWKKGPAKRTPDGAISVVVYNDLEEKEIPNTNQDGKRPRGRFLHSIKGENLLKILEYGARPHTFGPSNYPVLKFLAPHGGVTSAFGGTAFTGRGLEAFLYRDPTRNAKVGVESVDHPGVSADHLIRDAQAQVEARLAQEVAAVLAGVSSKLV